MKYYCNCCGTDFTSEETDPEYPECPECGCIFDEENDFIESYNE